MLRLKQFYTLTKPGIIYGNTLTVLAGYLYASDWKIDFLKLIAVTIGSALVIGSAGVINNILDRTIDQRMDRTKQRPLISGAITFKEALWFGTLLAILGFGLLLLTNYLVLVLGIVGYLDYLVLYSYFKRRSRFSTLVGTISGAVPLVAGYETYLDKLNLIALILFLFMVFWQMVHFYAIAINRIKEYKKAQIPLNPIVKSINNTILQIRLFYLGLVIDLILLGLYGGISLVVDLIGGLILLYWSSFIFQSMDPKSYKSWAQRIFKMSLIFLLVFSFLIVLPK
jgi:protoheme IX farnesyltransferase